MLPKQNRLKTKEFKEVFEKGQKYITPSLLFVYIKNKDRSAISCGVSKKLYPNAADRNRIRRVLYECIKNIPVGYHIVILLKNKIDKKDQGSLCAEISGFINSL